MKGCRIEDPFLGFNELKCEWVADKSWSYRVNIPRRPKATHGVKHVLAFDGLDTYATVKLDGSTIMESDNMFIMHRVDVSSMLSDSEDKLLQIEFKSALLESQKIKAAHPEHKWVGFNGDMARLAARKAQYHYGWDWGPVRTPSLFQKCCKAYISTDPNDLRTVASYSNRDISSARRGLTDRLRSRYQL